MSPIPYIIFLLAISTSQKAVVKEHISPHHHPHQFLNEQIEKHVHIRYESKNPTPVFIHKRN